MNLYLLNCFFFLLCSFLYSLSSFIVHVLHFASMQIERETVSSGKNSAGDSGFFTGMLYNDLYNFS